MLVQVRGEFPTTHDDQAVTRRLLELAHGTRHVTVQKTGVPQHPRQRGRGHELGHLVHALGESDGVARVRPDGGELLVGGATEEQRIGLTHLFDDQADVVFADELVLPARRRVVVRVARRLHDAVEGDELLDDHWAHSTPSERAARCETSP